MEKNRDAANFTLTETAEDFVSVILEDHECELFDNELEGLQ
jgi:hypothetical protein